MGTKKRNLKTTFILLEDKKAGINKRLMLNLRRRAQLGILTDDGCTIVAFQTINRHSLILSREADISLISLSRHSPPTSVNTAAAALVFILCRKPRIS